MALESLGTLPSPEELACELALSEKLRGVVKRERATVRSILSGMDRRVLAIVGPCSIHDCEEALEYARRLAGLGKKLEPSMHVILRAYFEKPRSVSGWKGLIMDPCLDGTCRVAEGLYVARRFLRDACELGLGCATEFLDPMIASYLTDFVSWGAIGARTASSQPHRELASGLPMPVGFKNPIDGDTKAAVDSALASTRPHVYPALAPDGRAGVVRTSGNPDAHLVLRGGSGGPNYRQADLERASNCLKAAGLRPAIIVDCSHGNSGKQAGRQGSVLSSITDQLLYGNARARGLRGFMLESYLDGGSQVLSDGSRPLYGLSITDPCLSWDDTKAILEECSGRLSAKARS